MSCERESILLDGTELSVVFCLVKTLHKFNSRIVKNRKSNTWHLLEMYRKLCSSHNLYIFSASFYRISRTSHPRCQKPKLYSSVTIRTASRFNTEKTRTIFHSDLEQLHFSVHRKYSSYEGVKLGRSH